MLANQPYDPRYNAKIYVPKLTEAQRRARATPLENLRSTKVQPVAEATDPRSNEATTPHTSPQEAIVPREVPAQQEVPAPEEMPAPEEVRVQQDTPASQFVPTALEIVFAEFPEIFTRPGERTLCVAHAEDNGLVSAGPTGNDAAWDRPRRSRACDGSRCTALLASETGTRTFPVTLYMDEEKEVERSPHILRNQAYPTPGCGLIVERVERASSARRASAAFSPGQRPGVSSQLPVPP